MQVVDPELLRPFEESIQGHCIDTENVVVVSSPQKVLKSVHVSECPSSLVVRCLTDGNRPDRSVL